jgi:hypothetical protein
MTVKQRAKRKPIQVVTGSYGRPVFNSYGLVVGVQVIDKTRWSKSR